MSTLGEACRVLSILKAYNRLRLLARVKHGYGHCSPDHRCQNLDLNHDLRAMSRKAIITSADTTIDALVIV